MFGRVFNAGFGQGISIKHAVGLIAKYVPQAKITFKPWPELDRQIETGDYISDISLLRQEIGWKPVVGMEEGIKATIDFYRGKAL